MRRLLTLFFVLTFTLSAGAQSEKKNILVKADSLLVKMYNKTPYDTAYVVRPSGRFSLRFKSDQTGNDIYTKGTVNGIKSKARLRTRFKTTVGVDVAYRGLSVALSVNPEKMKGSYNDFEFVLNYFGNRFSLDASYQRSTTLSGNVEYGIKQHLESGDVLLNIINLAGYYTFNHRHFSYPAAFTQLFIQKRSAGSWLAGISYQGGQLKSREALKERESNAPDLKFYMGHFGIGAGYGYNWVFAKKCMLHLSMLPTLVVYNRNKFIFNGVEKKASNARLNMIFNERVAFVWNISDRCFSGASLLMNNYLYNNNTITFNQNKWQACAFFGIRL